MLSRSAASGRLTKWPPTPLVGVFLCHTDSMENKSNNPYVNNLVEMGYDRADCEMVAAAGRDATYPRVIHGRTFDTKEQYEEELADYIAGLWQSTRCHTK